MQVIQDRRGVAMGGMQAQKAFTIQAGAHIMAVLSGLYKDPVDAMVREYSTNMYDAWLALHQQNPSAKYVPCELHLPTRLSPNLVFKDFGVGMSFDQVWDVYAQYGNSTKNGDNTAVGGFGLGSKTAFCYNNGQQWTVESRYNGEHMVFMAFIGEDSIPQLTHVSTSPTKEPNGVTIRIPIPVNDHSRVQQAARKYIPYFPMDISVMNAETPILKPTYVLSGEYRLANGVHMGWGLQRGSGYRGSAITVVMGNVPYQVDQNNASANLFNLFDGIDLTMHVPVGALDIVPSRDNLKYTPRTATYFAEIVPALKSAVQSAVSDQLVTATTEYDALVRALAITSVLSRSVFFNAAYAWRGHPINVSVGITRSVDDLQKLDATVSTTVYGLSSSSRSTPDIIDGGVTTIHPSANNWIMIDDMPKGGATAAKAYIYKNWVNRTNGNRVARYGHKTGQIQLIKTTMTADVLRAVYGGIPKERVLFASDVDSKIKLPSTAIRNDALYRFDGGKVWGARVNVPAIVAGQPFYYVPLVQDAYTKRWVCRTGGSDVVRTLIDHAQRMGLSVPVLYGIKSNEISTFDATQWVSLPDAMVARYLDILNQSPIDTMRLVRYYSLSTVVTQLFDLLDLTGYAALSTRAGDWADFMTEMKCQKALYEKVQKTNIPLYVVTNGTVRAVLERFTTVPAMPHDPKIVKSIPDVEALQNRLMKKYPMVNVMLQQATSQYSYNKWAAFITHKATVMQYINNIDGV